MISKMTKWLKKRAIKKEIENLKFEMEMYRKLEIHDAVLSCIEHLNELEQELRELEKS